MAGGLDQAGQPLVTVELLQLDQAGRLAGWASAGRLTQARHGTPAIGLLGKMLVLAGGVTTQQDTSAAGLGDSNSYIDVQTERFLISTHKLSAKHGESGFVNPIL